MDLTNGTVIMAPDMGAQSVGSIVTEAQAHASSIQTILTDLETALAIVDQPAVLELLPSKYRAYVMALAAIEAAVQGITGS